MDEEWRKSIAAAIGCDTANLKTVKELLGDDEARNQHVRVDNGKYTFVKVFETTSIQILRHDQPWHEQQDAFNAIVSLMAELDAARVVLDAVRNLGDAAPIEIKVALEKHRALVDDREPPTKWAAS